MTHVRRSMTVALALTCASCLPYDHYSFKQLRFVVERFTARLIEENPKHRDHLGLVKFTLRKQRTTSGRESRYRLQTKDR